MVQGEGVGVAIKRGSRAYSACAGRDVSQNSISGSLPAEIGKLGRLVNLYILSLCALALAPFQGSAREQAPSAGGCNAEHGIGGRGAEHTPLVPAGTSARTASQARC